VAFLAEGRGSRGRGVVIIRISLLAGSSTLLLLRLGRLGRLLRCLLGLLRRLRLLRHCVVRVHQHLLLLGRAQDLCCVLLLLLGLAVSCRDLRIVLTRQTPLSTRLLLLLHEWVWVSMSSVHGGGH